MLNPDRTLAIVCGADRWPYLDNFEAADAFANSAGLIRKYLAGGEGLELAEDHILWLFGEPKVGEQYARIEDFLTAKFNTFGAARGKGVLILFFYVGHGALFGTEDQYCLLVQDTRKPLLDATSLQVAALATLFRELARESSRILFLDCCFAGQAARLFQTEPDQVVSAKAHEVVAASPADRGVALFCASSAFNPAKIKSQDSYTWFSHALTTVLTAGDPYAPDPLTLRQLCGLVQTKLQEVAGESAPKPEVHSPNQKAGDLADVPLFPNPALAEDQISDTLRHTAAEEGINYSRIALVAAGLKASAKLGEAFEEIGTGYFLTGDLVLTASRIAARPDYAMRVGAKVAGTDYYSWSDAEPQWTGAAGVDLMLLRTARSFGEWTAPAIQEINGGIAWESAAVKLGPAEATGEENHNIVALHGSCHASVQASADEVVFEAEGVVDGWEGISGAPVFSRSQNGIGLIGVITDLDLISPRALIGLPATRLLNDLRFRSLIKPSFLGTLPTDPWCLVLTEESVGSDPVELDLVGQVGDVLAGLRFEQLLFPRPVVISVLNAIKSPENWAITVDAMARADYLIADVTSFEPAVMMLLGVRSVVRRGVTVSVTKEVFSTHASSIPFNVQETRVLSYSEPDFYDSLRRAMTEGAENLEKDANYLDLPAYHAVRAPRPEVWAQSDAQSVLVLCPFSPEYSAFYTRLKSIIRGRTGHITPLRMLDLRSPRLVGQALYEQIRWSSRCLIDWTYWRPNVFFELGVRLACSEYDPLCIIQRSSTPNAETSDVSDVPSSSLGQYELLRDLLGPVEYDRVNPRADLNDVLESWPGPLQTESIEAFAKGALPPAATYAVAQASFQWRSDTMLIPPYLEQRQTVERIVGSKDQERQPERLRLTLFADNRQFDAELKIAVREKWIAAWLYLRHLCTAAEAPSDEVRNEFATVSQLALRALSQSQDPRHKDLRREIRQFLRDESPSSRAEESGSDSG